MGSTEGGGKFFIGYALMHIDINTTSYKKMRGYFHIHFLLKTNIIKGDRKRTIRIFEWEFI